MQFILQFNPVSTLKTNRKKHLEMDYIEKVADRKNHIAHNNYVA